MPTGFIYVFSNPGLSAFKVGYTTRALYLRRDELQGEYGTAYPFEIASRHAVDDPAAVEAEAHRILGRYRVPRSELFTCDLATCQTAILDAARLVLKRPWKLRLWYWLILPKPPPRRPYRPGQTYYRNHSPGSLGLLLLVGILVAALVQLKPDLPPWLPVSVFRAALRLERLH